MRRLVFPVIVASGLVMIGSSAAFAEDPAPTVSAPSVAGKKMCAIKDERITEASGLVATRSGYVVINDSTDKNANKRIFFLDAKCEVTKAVKYSGDGPLDPEDLVLSSDGAKLWIADIGDNNFDNDESRRTIGLWSIAADGKGEPVLHRLSYPEGDKHDAEALLLNGDGTPLIVTKEIGKPAGVYQPTAPLKANNKEGVPMRRVAEIQPSATQTAGGPYARIGNKTISGGAVAPGGGKVVLRTYTDALEWDVKNGDVLGAIKGKPRTTGLPNETLGEAITYSADGKYFYTTSDMSGETEPPNHILRYTPATTVATAAKDGDDSGGAWYANLELSDITYAVGGVGLLGLILVGVGAMGIARHRKRVAASPDSASASASSDDDFKNPLEGEPETELIGVGGAPQRAGVYGGARPVNGSASGPKAGVYGGNTNGQRPVSGKPQGGRPANGQPARAGVYGGPQGGQPPRGPQGQPPRGPQGQPPRGPQGQPPRGPQGQPPRGPQGQPPRGPQGQPPRGPQGQPPRGPQGQPPRGPQGQPRGPQAQPPRGPQGQPPRGPQGQPPRGPQPRGGGGVYGGGQGGPPPSARGGRNDFQQRPEGRFDGYGPRR